jgi:hypothetical protein
MATRRDDGLYYSHEPDSELVNRIALDLLVRQARDISTSRAAADLVQDYPELADFGYLADDRLLDDLRDAIWQACARAVISIPTETPPAKPAPELSERLAQLLDAIRAEGGVWTGRRARSAYEKVDFWCTNGRGYVNLKLLAERGYLKQTGPRKMSYVLAEESSG